MGISILLSLVGLLAIFLEFFLPGAIFAFIGGLLVIGGVALFSLLELPIYLKIFYFVANMVLTAATCKLALKFITARKENTLLLQANQEGFTIHSFDNTLLEKEGEADTDLKPSGHILVAGQRLQAVSERGYIPKGKPIQIIAGRGATYIVKEKL